MLADAPTSEFAAPLAGRPSWSITVSAVFRRLGMTQYHADLFRFDEWVCRISLNRPVASRAHAERVLEERCRNWIARQEERPRRGDTDFQILS